MTASNVNVVAVQMSLPYIARSTATQAVKRNIRFNEVAACQDPNRLAWRTTDILARHRRDRAAARLAQPQRFDRCPPLAERTLRQSPPPPVCDGCEQCASSCACSCELDADEADDDDDDDNNNNANYTHSMVIFALCLLSFLLCYSLTMTLPLDAAIWYGLMPAS